LIDHLVIVALSYPKYNIERMFYATVKLILFKTINFKKKIYKLWMTVYYRLLFLAVNCNRPAL
jgi:hypothetical protein